MTRVHFVRHAAFDEVGQRLVGRSSGVTLSTEGRAQAAALGALLRGERLAAVYTSPLERALETATAIARPHALQPIACAAFAELDFGEWTGSAVDELEEHRSWRDFNTLRSLTRIPGGELMLETQTRAVAGLLELQRRHEEQTIAIVSHADVIRSVIGHVLGIPMDYLLRLEIRPASVCTMQLHGAWPQVLCIGRTAEEGSERAS